MSLCRSCIRSFPVTFCTRFDEMPEPRRSTAKSQPSDSKNLGQVNQDPNVRDLSVPSPTVFLPRGRPIGDRNPGRCQKGESDRDLFPIPIFFTLEEDVLSKHTPALADGGGGADSFSPTGVSIPHGCNAASTNVMSLDNIPLRGHGPASG